MLIKFRCPACNHKLRAEAAYAGRHANCGKCKQPVTVPESSTLSSDDKSPPEDEQPVEPNWNGNGPAPLFITFNCPGCGKRVGFPAHLPGTPARCPACKLPLMIPDRPGGESFLIGSMPTVGASVPKTVSPRQQPASNTGPEREPASVPAAKMGPVRQLGSVPVPPAHEPAAATTPSAASRSGQAQGIVAPRPDPWRPAPRRQLPVWALLLLGLTLLAAVAVGGPWLLRLLRQAVGTTMEAQPPAAPSAPRPPVANAIATPMPAEEPKAPPQVAAPAVPLGMDQAGPDPLEPLEIHTAPGVPPEPAAGIGDLLALPGRNQARSQDDDDREQPAKAKSARLASGGLEKRLERISTQTPEPNPPEPQCAPEAPQAAARVAPLPLPCERCMGTKFIPRLPFTPYVFLEKDMPNPAAAVPWQYCPACQRGQDNSALLQAEAERLKTVLEAHRQWEEQNHLKLSSAETHHVTLHAQLPEATLRQVAGALEKLAAYLEQATFTTVLCQTRPATHELVLLTDPQSLDFHRGMRMRHGETDERHKQVAVIVQGMTAPAENAALFRMGRMFMAEATDGKAPAWLSEGFAGYCENVVTRKNLNYPMTNAPDAIRPGENWDSGLRRLAGQGKLPQLEHLFALSRHNMSPTEYAAVYSLVAFLFKASPRDFVRFVLEVRGGVPSTAALERVYGRNAKEMQSLWEKWVPKI